jgi:hypothetical protein
VTFAHDAYPWFDEALEQRIGRAKAVGESRLAIDMIGVMGKKDRSLRQLLRGTAIGVGAAAGCDLLAISKA